VSVANIIGVPLGTWVGQQMGWRASFWSVSALGLLGTLAVVIWIPSIQIGQNSRLRQELRVLKSSQVQLTFLMTILSFVGIFAAFTFIAPILTEITGFSSEQITPILLLYGVGLTMGNTIAGKLANRSIMPTAIGGLTLSALVMGLLYFTMHVKWAAVVTILLWGLASFGHVPALQMRIIAKAKGAPNLASSLNISAFNLGIALGSSLGAGVIHSGLGLQVVPAAAAAFTIVAILVAVIGWKRDEGASIEDAKA
jgi:DHA1 family inner membrane transport protein